MRRALPRHDHAGEADMSNTWFGLININQDPAWCARCHRLSMVMVPGLPWEANEHCPEMAEPQVDFDEMTGWVCTDSECAKDGGHRKVHRKMGPTKDPRWSLPVQVPKA